MARSRPVLASLTTLVVCIGMGLLPSDVGASLCPPTGETWLCNTSNYPHYSCYAICPNMGGAIVELTADWTLPFILSHYTFVNNGYTYDYGRQIQVDMYMPSQNYPTNCWPCDSGCHWGWNPVQAGSCLQSPSGASGSLQVIQGTNLLYTRTQPNHWDPELGRSNVILEQRLEYVLWNALKITYTITNNESFSLQNASYDLPVAYFDTVLNRAVTYKGQQPWTNGPLTTLQIPIQNNTSVDVQPTENWMAWLETFAGDGADHGVALYVPPQGNLRFYGMGRLGGTGVPPTNFMQVFQYFTLAQGQSKSVVAYLVDGTIQEIRSSVYTLAGH